MSQTKTALLQRQQAFQRDAINNEHKLVAICKDQIKWLKGVPDIACTQKRIDVLYKCVEASKKRIAKLVEMQKFTKGELQEAYNVVELSRWEKLGTWGVVDDYFQSLDYHLAGAEKYRKHPSDFLWNNAPGGLWHDATTWKWSTPTESFKVVGLGGTGCMGGPPADRSWYDAPGGLRNEYKHNPKFMTEAPAAEVGSVVGDEL